MNKVDGQMDSVKIDAAALALKARKESTWDPEQEFSLIRWVTEVEASDLPHKVKHTARTMAAAANSRGYSTIDNQTLAEFAGVNRLNTITDRLKKLRGSHLLESIARFNTSSVHKLISPTGTHPHPLDRWVSDLAPIPAGETF